MAHEMYGSEDEEFYEPTIRHNVVKTPTLSTAPVPTTPKRFEAEASVKGKKRKVEGGDDAEVSLTYNA
jgi:hypothetical protein